MTVRSPHESWQLDEGSAEAYERYLVPLHFAPWAEALLDRVGPRPGERVLDVATGTGIVARRAAPRVAPGGRVVGLDLNDGMLAVARTAAADARPAIAWVRGDAAALPFGDAAFDRVLCQQALQFLPEPVLALREMRRVTAPGGSLGLGVLRGLEHHPAYRALADALERHAGREAAAMMRSPFPAWSADDLRGMLREAGWGEIEIRIEVHGVRYPSAAEFLRQEAASSPLAGPLGALEEAAREALLDDATEALHDRNDDAGVVVPMETRLIVARA